MSLTKDHAAQPVLTDAMILHRWDTYVGELSAGTTIEDSDKIAFARAIEFALLSKLRAPVDDERAAFEAWCERNEFDHWLRLDGTGYNHDATRRAWNAWQARAALASAPVSGNSVCKGSMALGSGCGKCERCRAELASAPVAGDALNYPGDDVAERLDNMADDQPPGSQAQSDLYAAATIWRKHIAHHAAPQASEVVRVQQLEAARIAYASEFPPDENGDPDVGNIHANIRKLKSQLAALSAQPGAQKNG